METQALTLYERLDDPVSAVEKLGTMFAKSGLYRCDRTEQGQVLALACLAERKSPIQIMREYHLFNGRLSDRADSMLGKFRAAGGRHKVIKRTPDEAEVELTFEKQTQSFRLTWEEVQQEPFVWSNKVDGDGNPIPKDNWKTPRVRMQTLWARVISDGVRTMAPEIVAGVYTPEEISDQAPEPTNVAPLFPEKTATPEDPPRGTETRKEPKSQPGKKGGETRTAPPQPADAPEKVEPPKAKDAGSAAEQPVDAEELPATDPNTGKLTLESVKLLESKIGEENAEAVLSWLEGRKWIPKDGTLLDLPLDKAKRIIAAPEKVIATAKGGAR